MRGQAHAPSTADDVVVFWEECEERKNAIDEWEEEQTGDLILRWLDRDVGFREGARKEREIQEKAEEMREKLIDNCQTKADRAFSQTVPK